MSTSGTPHDTLNALFRKLGGDIHHLKANIGLIPFLLPHLHFSPDNLLHSDFLNITNELIIKKYPPPAPEDHVLVLSVLEGVAKVIGACEVDVLLRALAVLKEGLGVWVREEGKVLLEQEHTTIVRDIYCQSLSKLSTLPPTLTLLHSLSSFLASSFERMGYPPIGPLAFEQFWRLGLYHEQNEEFKRNVPEDLKICLKAWSDHCGDSLAEGVGETQSTMGSVAPDSQSSPDKPGAGNFSLGDYVYDAPREMDSDEEIQLDLVLAPSSDPAPVDLVLSRYQLSQNTPTVEVEVMTPRATTPRPDRLRAKVSRGVGEQISSVMERIAGQKRSGSDSGTSGGRVIKRRRTDHEAEGRSPSASPKRYSRSSSKNNQPNDASAKLKNRSPSQPSVTGRRQNGSPASRRRFIVPPSPQTEEFVPGTSSPTGPIASSSPSHFKNSPIIRTSKYDDHEVVDDSMEMMDFLPNLVHHQEDDPRHSRHSSHKRLHSEPAFESNPPSRPTQLKRNHTNSERLGALERAYSLVADSQGSSQVPIEELARAAQLAHKIGAKIAEQMSKKFPSERA